ncbi:hypothetical protein D0469_17295 [Peribacillus saganii]|uniref:Uncharacterized protein n=1 Tax=Peribacillus saganii TaxID=2303992 RepID=A0A372LL10_9BACI|nr:hypothetical protein [Peribacillus saganii]RFU66388.1 hypothetical protein D0469_17295 [Peribacillus saganii]
MSDKRNEKLLEVILWSIALPGFSQLLNGKLLKGFLFVTLEFVINVRSNFNQVIILSFYGRVQESIEQTNYQWLMFYPCLYMFAMWDAYKDAGGGKSKFSFLPFVFAAYFITVGLIYSPTLKIFGVLIGPIWLPILSLPIGLAVGYFIKKIVHRIV